MLLNILYFIQLISSSDLGTKTKIKVETVTTDKPGTYTVNNTETGTGNETGTNTEIDNIKKAILFTNYEYNDRNLAIMKQLIFETTIWPAFVSCTNTKDISKYEPNKRLLFFFEEFRNTIIDCFRNLNLNISFKTLNDDLNFDEKCTSCKNDCFLCFAISENNVNNNAKKFLYSNYINEISINDYVISDNFQNEGLTNKTEFKNIFNYLFQLNCVCYCKNSNRNKFFFGFYISNCIIKDLFDSSTEVLKMLEIFKILKNPEKFAGQSYDAQECFLKNLSTSFTKEKVPINNNIFKFLKKQNETQCNEYNLNCIETIAPKNEILLLSQDKKIKIPYSFITDTKKIGIQIDKSTKKSNKKIFKEDIKANFDKKADEQILNQNFDESIATVKKKLYTSNFEFFIDTTALDKKTEASAILHKTFEAISNIKNIKFQFLIITSKNLNEFDSFSNKFSEFKTKKNCVFPFFLYDLLFETANEISKESLYQNYIKNLEFMRENYFKALKSLDCDPLEVSKNFFDLQKKTDLCFFLNTYYLFKSDIEEICYKLSLSFNKIFVFSFNAINNNICMAKRNI